MGYEVTALLLLMVAGGYALQKLFRRVTVFEYERGLMYEKGTLSKLLNAGIYWYNSSHTEIRKIDIRPRYQTIPSQEVLTKDGVTIKLSMAANIKVEKPDLVVTASNNYEEASYLALQLALRSVVGSTEIGHLLERRAELGKEIYEISCKELEKIGLKLISIEIKDITFPGPLKQTFSQIVKARHEGLAALERARAESAALRNLANSAKLLEKNPTLMHLRTLQSFNESSGNTLILNLSSEELVPSRGTQKDPV